MAYLLLLLVLVLLVLRLRLALHHYHRLLWMLTLLLHLVLRQVLLLDRSKLLKSLPRAKESNRERS